MFLTNQIIAFETILVLEFVKPGKKDETPTRYYLAAGIVFSLAMVLTTLSLRYVTFPMQVIMKSAKPIAVMLINLFMCKRYTIQRYFFVSLIVAGLLLFKFFEEPAKKEASKVDVKSNDVDAEMGQWIGIAILSVSLLMDGTLGAIEDRIRRLYKPTSNQMMTSICGWSSEVLIIWVAASQEIVEVYNFATRHPIILWQLALLGLAGAVGQLFIFTMVTSFGALPCSITTTVRKFISVVFSIIFYKNPSTAVQWVAIVLVFSALLADAFWGKKQLFGKKKEHDAVKATAPKLDDAQTSGQNPV